MFTLAHLCPGEMVISKYLSAVTSWTVLGIGETELINQYLFVFPLYFSSNWFKFDLAGAAKSFSDSIQVLQDIGGSSHWASLLWI